LSRIGKPPPSRPFIDKIDALCNFQRVTHRTRRLKIHLSPSLQESVQRWIATFAEKEQNWAEYPYVENDFLNITAPCFPFFLAYADPKDSNEFDLHRLQAMGRNEIIRRLSQMQSMALSRYYQQALDNLETIRVGEFLV
jgi:hypothetical protein